MPISQIEKPSRVVNLDEWARETNLARSTAYDLARKNQIPGLIRLGKRYLVSRAVMERMLNGEN